MTTHSVFTSRAYLDLEAARIEGQVIPIGGAGLISRSVPGESLADLVSVYGYPTLGSADASQPFDVDAFIRTTSEYGRKNGLVAAYIRLGIEDDVGVPANAQFAALVNVADVVVVDLQRAYEDTMKAYRQRFRNELRQPHAFMFEASTDVWAFHEIYTQNMKRVSAQDQYFFTPEYLNALCGLPGVALWVALDEDGIVAGAITIEQAGRIFYHLGATADRALPNSPFKYLLNDIIQSHCEGDFSELVLGGGYGGVEDSLLRFKRGFSKKMRSVRALRLILDPIEYRRLSQDKGVGHIDEGFFPAYRAP